MRAKFQRMTVILLFLLVIAPSLSTPTPPLHPAEEAALRAIYEEGEGNSWREPMVSKTWLQPGVPPCTWAGIQCVHEPGSNYSSVSQLYLEGYGLRHLSDKVGALSKLEFLGVANNKLSALPETIGDLSNLSTLSCYLNDLLTLPSTIGKLTNLSKL